MNKTRRINLGSIRYGSILVIDEEKCFEAKLEIPVSNFFVGKLPDDLWMSRWRLR